MTDLEQHAALTQAIRDLMPDIDQAIGDVEGRLSAEDLAAHVEVVILKAAGFEYVLAFQHSAGGVGRFVVICRRQTGGYEHSLLLRDATVAVKTAALPAIPKLIEDLRAASRQNVAAVEEDLTSARKALETLKAFVASFERKG